MKQQVNRVKSNTTNDTPSGYKAVLSAVLPISMKAAATKMTKSPSLPVSVKRMLSTEEK